MDAQQFQNALRIMMSLDEVANVLPREKAIEFHSDPLGCALRMDGATWEKVFKLIEKRNPGKFRFSY